MLEGPRLVRKEEYPELLNFMNRIFFPNEPQRMENQYKHVYKGFSQKIQHNFIFKSDNKIVSHVGVYPMTLTIGSEILETRGIGGVVTDEKMRRQGLMTKLMQSAVESMRKEGVAFSVLWGHRWRYSRFGWEYGGRQFMFTVDKRSLKKINLLEYKIKKYTGKQNEVKIIQKLHDKEPFRVIRDTQKYREKLTNFASQVFICSKEKKVAYSIVVPEGNSRVFSEFAGDADCFQALLNYFLQLPEVNYLSIPVPYPKHKLLKVVFDNSGFWTLQPIGMLKIVDLKKTLIAFRKQIQLRIIQTNKQVNISVTLKMSDSNQESTLLIKNKKVVVTDKPVKNKIVLTDCEMVNLLFGTFPPDKIFQFNKNLCQLSYVLPLDFYIWRPDYV